MLNSLVSSSPKYPPFLLRLRDRIRKAAVIGHKIHAGLLPPIFHRNVSLHWWLFCCSCCCYWWWISLWIKMLSCEFCLKITAECIVKWALWSLSQNQQVLSIRMFPCCQGMLIKLAVANWTCRQGTYLAYIFSEKKPIPATIFSSKWIKRVSFLFFPMVLMAFVTETESWTRWDAPISWCFVFLTCPKDFSTGLPM